MRLIKFHIVCYHILGLNWAMKMTTEQKSEVWSRHELGQDICYSTLGIVGMGSIGYKLAQRAKGFNMKIVYHNRNRRLV